MHGHSERREAESKNSGEVTFKVAVPGSLDFARDDGVAVTK